MDFGVKHLTLMIIPCAKKLWKWLVFNQTIYQVIVHFFTISAYHCIVVLRVLLLQGSVKILNCGDSIILLFCITILNELLIDQNLHLFIEIKVALSKMGFLFEFALKFSWFGCRCMTPTNLTNDFSFECIGNFVVLIINRRIQLWRVDIESCWPAFGYVLRNIRREWHHIIDVFLTFRWNSQVIRIFMSLYFALF